MTRSVLLLLDVIVVEMMVDVPAATANEVDREHDRHHYRKQDRVPGVGKDSHARKARKPDRAGETPVRVILRVPVSSTPVPSRGIRRAGTLDTLVWCH